MSRDAVSIMRAEMRVRYGPVADNLDGDHVALGTHRMSPSAFLMRTPSGFGFDYRRGAGVLVDRPAGSGAIEEELWLNGSVYTAVASIAGLYPVHASAVAEAGRVFAFTGQSGAGKSTLVTGLGNLGLPMFCDDTMLLDHLDPGTLNSGAIFALPGHKRLKLTDEALALTGAEAFEQVDVEISKRYARPAAGTIDTVLPVAALCVLEFGPELKIERIVGGERIARFNDDHYTALFYDYANRPTAAERFALQIRLADAIPLWRFTRPRDAERFAQSAAFIADWIRHQPPSTRVP